jgi:hypothetical protein
MSVSAPLVPLDYIRAAWRFHYLLSFQLGPWAGTAIVIEPTLFLNLLVEKRRKKL